MHPQISRDMRDRALALSAKRKPRSISSCEDFFGVPSRQAPGVDPVRSLTLACSDLRGRRAAKRRCRTVRLGVEHRSLSREEFSLSETKR
jgi:hypothetical protein